jgi:hypothetical protein
MTVAVSIAGWCWRAINRFNVPKDRIKSGDPIE